MVNETSIRVPKKYQHMIDEIYQDPDGYWCCLNQGWRSPSTGCHTIHEDSQPEVLRCIREVIPCPDCPNDY